MKVCMLDPVSNVMQTLLACRKRFSLNGKILNSFYVKKKANNFVTLEKCQCFQEKRSKRVQSHSS